jgi:hypothetical protein
VAEIRTGAEVPPGRALRMIQTAPYNALLPSEEDLPLMTNAPVPPTRQAVLRMLTTIVALATSEVLAGCGTSTTPTLGAMAGGVASSTTPTPGATAGGVAPSTLVMIIRHGENRATPTRASTHRGTRTTAR